MHGNIDQTFIDPLMDPAPCAPHDTHPVLHTEGQSGNTVIFGNRDIDDLIRLKNLRIKRPGFQDLSLQGDLPEFPVIDIID